MATSGTVATYGYDQQQVIDHAARRAGFLPQKIAGESQITARDTLFTLLSELVTAGMPLWTRTFGLVGIQIGSPEAAAAPGTLDILHCYWRILNPWRGQATLTDNSGGSVLFAGAPNADVSVPGPNPFVQVNFTSPTELDTIGVLLGGSTPITVALDVLGSNDGISFAVVQTLPSAVYVPGAWTYFDLDPSLTYQYIRLRYNATGPWLLNQLNFGLANGQDIEAGPLSIDDYYNLPNKQFQADRVVSAYTDRKLTVPVMKLWPTPSTTAFYNGTMSVLGRRYIQDPGAFSNSLEVPPRFLEAVIWRLASRLVDELPADARDPAISLQERMARTDRCEKMAARSEQLAWGEERTRGPIRLMPSIAPYTR